MMSLHLPVAGASGSIGASTRPPASISADSVLPAPEAPLSAILGTRAARAAVVKVSSFESGLGVEGVDKGIAFLVSDLGLLWLVTRAE